MVAGERQSGRWWAREDGGSCQAGQVTSGWDPRLAPKRQIKCQLCSASWGTRGQFKNQLSTKTARLKFKKMEVFCRGNFHTHAHKFPVSGIASGWHQQPRMRFLQLRFGCSALRMARKAHFLPQPRPTHPRATQPRAILRHPCRDGPIHPHPTSRNPRNSSPHAATPLAKRTQRPRQLRPRPVHSGEQPASAFAAPEPPPPPHPPASCQRFWQPPPFCAFTVCFAAPQHPLQRAARSKQPASAFAAPEPSLPHPTRPSASCQRFWQPPPFCTPAATAQLALATHAAATLCGRSSAAAALRPCSAPAWAPRLHPCLRQPCCPLDRSTARCPPPFRLQCTEHAPTPSHAHVTGKKCSPAWGWADPSPFFCCLTTRHASAFLCRPLCALTSTQTTPPSQWNHSPNAGQLNKAHDTFTVTSKA